MKPNFKTEREEREHELKKNSATKGFLKISFSILSALSFIGICSLFDILMSLTEQNIAATLYAGVTTIVYVWYVSDFYRQAIEESDRKHQIELLRIRDKYDPQRFDPHAR